MNGGMEECNHQSYCGVLHSLTLGPINPLISYIHPHTNTFFSSPMQNGFRTSAINPSWISLKSLTEWILSPYQGFVELVLSSPHAAQVIEKRGRAASLSRADVADLNPRQLYWLPVAASAPPCQQGDMCHGPLSLGVTAAAAAGDAGITHPCPAPTAPHWVWFPLQLYILGLGRTLHSLHKSAFLLTEPHFLVAANWVSTFRELRSLLL